MCPHVNFLNAFKKECAMGIIHIEEQYKWPKKTAAEAAVFKVLILV
jgi:hypothetical protein